MCCGGSELRTMWPLSGGPACRQAVTLEYYIYLLCLRLLSHSGTRALTRSLVGVETAAFLFSLLLVLPLPPANPCGLRVATQHSAWAPPEAHPHAKLVGLAMSGKQVLGTETGSCCGRCCEICVKVIELCMWVWAFDVCVRGLKKRLCLAFVGLGCKFFL